MKRVSIDVWIIEWAYAWIFWVCGWIFGYDIIQRNVARKLVAFTLSAIYALMQLAIIHAIAM